MNGISQSSLALLKLVHSLKSEPNLPAHGEKRSGTSNHSYSVESSADETMVDSKSERRAGGKLKYVQLPNITVSLGFNTG